MGGGKQQIAGHQQRQVCQKQGRQGAYPENQNKREQGTAGDISDVVGNINPGAGITRCAGAQNKKTVWQYKPKQKTVWGDAQKAEQQGGIKPHRASLDKYKITQVANCHNLQKSEEAQQQGKPSQDMGGGFVGILHKNAGHQSADTTQNQPVEKNQGDDDLIALEL